MQPITFAKNGVEALQRLQNYSSIDLVLTDINMPEIDSLKPLSKMTELKRPLLRSVIVSAYGDMENIRTAMNRGAFDFVIKPIDLNDLEITIYKSLDDLYKLKEAMQSRDQLITPQHRWLLPGRSRCRCCRKRFLRFRTGRNLISMPK